MPRDLRQGLSGPMPLTESPGSTLSPAPTSDKDQKQERNGQMVLRQPNAEADSPASSTLHPYTRPLTIADVNSCEALENAAFETAEERCSREKFAYRLTKCGNLSLGLFCTALPGSNISAETLATGSPVETSRRNGAVGVLMAHIVSTMSEASTVTDKAMDFPKDWSSPNLAASDQGHQDSGATICLHSLAVLPKFQGRGLGRILLTSYLQQMSGAGIASRIALIAHEHMIPYYEKFGFSNKGPSNAEFGGGGWYDMVFELRSVERRAMYG